MKLNEIKTDIDAICERYKITNFTINDDGSIDVEGDVNLPHSTFTKLPLKFGRVTGNFYCYSCVNLISLEGAPSFVTGNFYCYDCANLNSLEGAPTEVTGNFNCSSCSKLTSLEGAPTSIGGAFYCSNCPRLTKLDHIKSAKSLYLKFTPINNILYTFKIKRLEEISTGIDGIDAIINKYLTSNRDIMDCQEELIEAGFEKYARTK